MRKSKVVEVAISAFGEHDRIVRVWVKREDGVKRFYTPSRASAWRAERAAAKSERLYQLFAHVSLGHAAWLAVPKLPDVD